MAITSGARLAAAVSADAFLRCAKLMMEVEA